MMKAFHQLVFSVSLICFLFIADPAHSKTLAKDKAPEVARIPAGLPHDQDSVLRKRLADIATLRITFGAAMEDYNKTPRTGIVVGSSQETELNNKIGAVNKARAAYIALVKKFNADVAAVNIPASSPAITRMPQDHTTDALAVERLRTIKAMSAYAHRQLEWSEKKKARVDAALNKLGADGDPDATSPLIREAWSHVLARDTKDLADEASKGEGPGFPGAGTQSHQDCAVFALANAAGLPYGLVAARATDLIRKAEWRQGDERAAPEQTISRRGLNGGEVIILAETFGQATIVSSSDFAKTLQDGHRILINVVPASGAVDSGHEIVLSKTFEHGGETWFAVMDSNQPADKHLYLSSKELNTILKENGVMFQPDPNRTPALLRKRKD